MSQRRLVSMQVGDGSARPQRSGAKRSPLRLELEGNRIAADRIWAHRTPGAIVCMGMAPSEPLARFAFLDHGDDPFFQLCRLIDREIARGKLTKAKQLRLPRSALAEPALRRLAIAISLLRAGFDPDEPRDAQGRWTTNGGDDHSSPAPTTSPAQSPGQSPKQSPNDLLIPVDAKSAGTLRKNPLPIFSANFSRRRTSKSP